MSVRVEVIGKDGKSFGGEIAPGSVIRFTVPSPVRAGHIRHGGDLLGNALSCEVEYIVDRKLYPVPDIAKTEAEVKADRAIVAEDKRALNAFPGPRPNRPRA